MTASTSSPAEDVPIPYRFTSPELYCPFPAAINPHTESVYQGTLEWGDEHGLLGKGETREQQAKEQHAWLVGRVFPHASRERFQLLSDWTSWLFWHDDVCDETSLGQSPEGLCRQFDQLFGILNGTTPVRPGNAFDLALVEMTDRFKALAPDDAWIHRFMINVQEYFQACIWEARNRGSHETPSLDEFIPMRRYAGGTWIYLDFLEFANVQTLPLEVREHAHVRHLMQITCDIACWHNDIFSWPKEMRRNDVHNLIPVLEAELGLTMGMAMRMAVKYCNSEVKEFISLSETLPVFAPPLDEHLRAYIDGLRMIMRGNLDWATESSRYKKQTTRSYEARKLPEAVTAQANNLTI